MNENQLMKLKDSMAFFCEGLRVISADPNDLLERYDHYFDVYCDCLELDINTWYDLRIANRDAQVYLMAQPEFVQLVVSPFDYMRYIDVLNSIVTIYQRFAEVKIETKKL